MSVTIPISNGRIDYRFTTGLSGVNYTLRFKYNYRSGVWMMDISDSEDNPIYLGIPIYVLTDILRQVRAYDVPQELMVCFNNLAPLEEPTRDSFSEDVILLYEVGT